MFSMNKKIDTMFEFFLNQTFKKFDQLQKKIYQLFIRVDSIMFVAQHVKD